MSISITPAVLPPIVIGNAYNQTLTASGGTGPYTWAIASGNFPSWATLNVSTGVISGTSTSFGNYLFTVQVTDALGATATITYTIVSGYTLVSDIAAWV